MFHSLLVSIISDEKSKDTQIKIPLYMKCHFLQIAFSIFPLSLVFSGLTMMCLGVLSSYLFSFGFNELLKPINLCLLGDHLAIILKYFFLAICLSSSGTPITYILTFIYDPTGSWGLIFFSLFLSSSNWIIITVLFQVHRTWEHEENTIKFIVADIGRVYYELDELKQFSKKIMLTRDVLSPSKSKEIRKLLLLNTSTVQGTFIYTLLLNPDHNQLI